MTRKKIIVAGQQVDYIFDGRLAMLRELVDRKQAILLTDEHVFAAHKAKFKGWRTIVIPAGEQHKQQSTADHIISELIAMEADRKTVLVGIGGGVITDMAGYVASVYMRGIAVGFVPTSLLAMVDAAIGGKNGVDVGIFKNLVGTIRQPSFLLFDTGLLKTLPETEWKNGFAEIIKHAAIRDSSMFRQLEQHDLAFFQKHHAALATLVQRNAMLKTRVVQADPFESGDRKLLNFGHTVGHAIENELQLPHGFAVAVGMVHAANFSQQITGFRGTLRLVEVLEKYGLPTHAALDAGQVMDMLKMDKKRVSRHVHFVLLEKIGKAIVHPLGLDQISRMLTNQPLD